MVVKAFCDKLFENKHEWNQFKEVYNLINEKYANIEEPIYILSNVFLSNAQIDVLILAIKGIAILELKSYEGKIYGSENGEWVVITANGKEVSLSENLFQQLNQQKFAIVDKLKVIRKGNFERIEEEKLYRIQCWGYFNKGSTYDINQVGERAHIWFDVITANDLIEKMSFFKAGYLLGSKDMDAIVKGLNLKPYSFEKPPIQEDSTFESNWRKQLSVFIEPQNWDKIFNKIKDSNIITVVGDRNAGKTTTIMNLAKELKKSGYRVHEDKDSLIRFFNQREEKDQKEYYHLINNKNVFILDDIFGKSEYEPGLGNKWVYLIIDFLDSSVNLSKIIIGSRRDVINDFLFNNNELNRCNLLNEFKNSIVDLKFSDYNEEKRKEIFDKNLNFIHLNDKNKEAILNKNIEKITKELLLPGDISYFIQKARDGDFRENKLNIYIERAKQQLNSIKIEINSLNDYERIFLYNLFINQNFSIDDLEAIYSHCLPLESTNRDYFTKCIENFEGKFINIKTETVLLSTERIKKLEFIHDVYKEAIEKLIKTNKEECRILEDILSKLFNSLHERSISDWNPDSEKYNIVKFHIFQTTLRYYADFSYHIKDSVIEILNNLSIKKLSIFERSLELSGWDDVLYILNENVKSYGSSKYIEQLFYNYDKFDDELKDKFKGLFKNIDYAEVLAYCYAYYLDPQTVIKFQDKLKELSNGSDEAKSRVAKCIIKNYDFINEDNKKLLLSLGLKTTIMKYLIHNYDLISNELKEILLEQIQSATENELIETGDVFLVNYSSLSENIIKHYEFIFKSNNELINKKIGKALSTWFDGAFTHLNYDKQREKIDNKVLNLYCEWLRSDKNEENTLDWCWHFIGAEGISAELTSSIYSYKEEKSDLLNPKWIDPFYEKLKEGIETRLINLLCLTNTPIKKGYIYSDAFDWFQCSGNYELLKRISNIINEEDTIKTEFLEECIWKTTDDIEIKEVNNFPFKITISQFKLIEELSKPPNGHEIRIKATEKLNYIKDLMDKKIIKITQDDYS